jgi:iron complex outermembrane receptor protein
MKNIFLVAVLFIASATSAFAQNVLKGKITDQQTNEALPFVSVVITDTQKGTTTNDKGEFELTHDSPITSITVSYVGYDKQIISVKPADNYLNISLGSNTTSLSEVVVVGHSNNRKLIETAGSIGYLSQKEIQRSNNVSLNQSLNTIPGVRMEENGFGGSTRLSIRGSQLRSPWGIRNIKVYWNDLPLTDPSGGTSAFNAIDVNSVGSIEVLKGPSGSIYGAGTGGVISISSDRAKFGDKGVEVSNVFGSFGLRRTLVSAKSVTANSSINVSYLDQNFDGYRDHNTVDKRVFNLMANFYPSDKQSISVFAFQSQSNFDLPGALDSTEVANNPRQAHPFAASGDCRVTNNRTMLGVSQRYELSNKLMNTTGIYGTFNNMDHPWGSGPFYNGYSIGNDFGYGTRTRFAYSPMIGKVQARINFGGEYQFSSNVEKQYGNNDGKPSGTLASDFEFSSQQGIVFTQVELDLPKKIILTLGGSLNFTNYDFIDRVIPDSLNPRLVTDFAPTFAPRIGLVKKIGEQIAVHGSVGYGFSPPSTWEIQTQAGINRNLNPESGINYEVGFRGTTLKNKLNFDVSTYMFQLTNAILPRVNEAQQTFFENTGSTDQFGIEAMISYLVFNDETKVISLLKPWISYTFNDYKFNDYKTESFSWSTFSVETQDFSGNRIPGVAPNILNVGIDLETRFGLYMITTLNFIDQMYLNNDNSKSVSSYTLLGSRMGYRKVFKKHYGLEIFGGIDNALNADYNIFVTINGFGGRYYNPGPKANYYGGISLKYLFN